MLPDLLQPDLKIVFCGVNPGLRAAAAGHHFLGNGNRFWQAVHLAGFTPEVLRPEQDARMLAYGFGLTTAVPRPTAKAGEVTRQEFHEGVAGLQAKVERLSPRCIAFLGKAAYAAISNEKQISWGRQAQRFGGALAWVLPNPSGLNRSFSLQQLVAAYAELRVAQLS